MYMYMYTITFLQNGFGYLRRKQVGPLCKGLLENFQDEAEVADVFLLIAHQLPHQLVIAARLLRYLLHENVGGYNIQLKLNEMPKMYIHMYMYTWV